LGLRGFVLLRLSAPIAIAAIFAIAGCASDAPAAPVAHAGDDGDYLTSAASRRATMVASLASTTNGYAKERLARYDSGDAMDWSRLPISNPAVSVIGEDGAPIEATPSPLSLDDPDLGEKAFFRYPVQEIDDALVLGSADAARASGFWSDSTRGLGGLVRVTYANGLSATAMTCATCHARKDAGASLVSGAPNGARLVIGAPNGARLVIGAPNGALDLGFGRGRVDVTTSTGAEPVAISDLRPVRFLSYLHHDANVKQTGEAALAVRIETLITTSHAEISRPPREVALALAAFVWSLADTLPPPPAPDARGAAAFAGACGSCHSPAGGAFTGEPVPLSVVGTDPAVGLSSERGTGNYRVPSLRGVSSRGALLHDLSVPSIPALLDPARSSGGHAFGRDLDDETRAAIVSYVSAL
jgi:mono/diheme cytochrome c family protein